MIYYDERQTRDVSYSERPESKNCPGELRHNVAQSHQGLQQPQHHGRQGHRWIHVRARNVAENLEKVARCDSRGDRGDVACLLTWMMVKTVKPKAAEGRWWVTGATAA